MPCATPGTVSATTSTKGQDAVRAVLSGNVDRDSVLRCMTRENIVFPKNRNLIMRFLFESHSRGSCPSRPVRSRSSHSPARPWNAAQADDGESAVRASVLDVKWISSEKRFARNFRWTWRHGNRTETETTGGALPGVRERVAQVMRRPRGAGVRAAIRGRRGARR